MIDLTSRVSRSGEATYATLLVRETKSQKASFDTQTGNRNNRIDRKLHRHKKIDKFEENIFLESISVRFSLCWIHANTQCTQIIGSS